MTTWISSRSSLSCSWAAAEVLLDQVPHRAGLQAERRQGRPDGVVQVASKTATFFLARQHQTLARQLQIVLLAHHLGGRPGSAGDRRQEMALLGGRLAVVVRDNEELSDHFGLVEQGEGQRMGWTRFRGGPPPSRPQPTGKGEAQTSPVAVPVLGGENELLGVQPLEVDGDISRRQALRDDRGNRRQDDVRIKTALQPVSQAGKLTRPLWAGVGNHVQLGFPARRPPMFRASQDVDELLGSVDLAHYRPLGRGGQSDVRCFATAPAVGMVRSQGSESLDRCADAGRIGHAACAFRNGG